MVEKLVFAICLYNHLNSILEKRDFLTYKLALNFRVNRPTSLVNFGGELPLRMTGESIPFVMHCRASQRGGKVNYVKHLELGNKQGGTNILTGHML